MSAAAGKLPALSRSGRHWLTLSMVLLIVGSGAGSWALAACGLATLAALLTLYLGFLPAAVLVWRRYLELLWQVERPAAGEGEQPGGLLVHRPFTLRVTLRNLGLLPLGRAEVRPFSSRCVEVVRPLPLLFLPPRRETSAGMELRALQAGEWFLHGAAVRLHDRFGLFTLEAYFPLTTPLKVLPRPAPRGSLPPLRLSTGAHDERLGVHTLRHRGVGGELRELRDYAPGDPFKLIAWKASARAPLGRLLVRDLDRETLITHTLLLDIGATMRQGPPGLWKLDHAIELCSAYARAVLEGGDSVGLITYDRRIFSQLKPGGGPLQRLQLTERLLEVMTPVDEDFTGAGDGEVCAAVARYLRQQEGLDARVPRPPAIDDVAAWAQIQVGPGGQLYDLKRLLAAARRALDLSDGERAERPGEVLRLFCRRRGIELPYHDPRGPVPLSPLPAEGGGEARPASPIEGGGAPAEPPLIDARAAGLEAALLRVAAVRGARKVVAISDLDGVLPGLARVARAVALCRRRGHQLLCLFPSAPRYVPKDLLGRPGAARAAEIFGWELRRREAEAQAALSRLGVPVIPVGPEDGLAQVLARMAEGKRPVLDFSFQPDLSPDQGA